MAIDIYNMVMESYNNIFADFLHMSFVVRISLFVVFVLLVLIILEALIVPLLLWLIGPVVVKGWNFAITETIYEYIYIKYLADTSKAPSDRISAIYNKQQKKVEKNYEYINNTYLFTESGISRGYRIIVNNKLTARFGQAFEKIIILISVVFVISTFAYDFAYSKGLGRIQASSKVNEYTDTAIVENSGTDSDEVSDTEPAVVDTTQKNTDTAIYYILSDSTAVANIRSEPSFKTSTVVEEVSKGQVLEYMGEQSPFEDDSGSYWYKVKTESGVIGWVSGRIIVQKE